MKKTPSPIHNFPEFSELRKGGQGANATSKGSIEKSKRRHEAKSQARTKALESKREGPVRRALDKFHSFPKYKDKHNYEPNND